MNVTMFRAAVVVGGAVQWEVWCRLQSSHQWEHVFLKSFDDERWCANFVTRHGTFVKICGLLAPRLVRQDT